MLWFGNSQLTGDSVTIFLKENEISKLDVDGAAFILSQDEDYPERFDQISGDKIILSFENSAINKTEIFGNTLSIYYLYDNGKPNGLNKSSSKNAVINFVDKKISTIQLYKSVEAEYYPENKVKGKELSFTLPRYIYYKNRPTSEELIYNLKK